MIVRNQREQPVELHLPERVLVLAPRGSAEVSAAEAESPQLRVLARRRLVSLTAPPPEQVKKPKQKAKGKQPQAEGDE